MSNSYASLYFKSSIKLFTLIRLLSKLLISFEKLSTSAFNLKSDGSLVAAAGNFTIATNGDLTSKGQISASSGDIGGVSIESTSIVAAGGAFSVNKSGAVVATNISLSGSVSATTGDIGGWVIAADKLSGGNVILDSDGSIQIGDLLNATTTATTRKGFFADNDGNVLIKGDDNDTNYIKFDADGGTSALQIKTANFSIIGGNVATKGSIIADDITTNSGSIGGFNLDTVKLQSSTTNKRGTKIEHGVGVRGYGQTNHFNSASLGPYSFGSTPPVPPPLSTK